MLLNYHEKDIIQVNALKTRAYYKIENNPATYLTKWKMEYFEEDNGDLESVTPQNEITTPSCLEMLGYGNHQYTNIKYPFPYAPPYILKKNPCAVYVTKYITVEKTGRYYINFDGVDSCFYLFVNGNFVGYSSVSHSPVEFDITDLIENVNEIRVIVFKYNWGSYLEDQDKFRMSGIFRDVYILNRCEGHLRDYKITTDVKDGVGVVCFNADEECEVMLSSEGKVLYEGKGKDVKLNLKNPKLWSDERPYLYDLFIYCKGEIIIERVGIRRVEVVKNQLLINGKAVKLKGVNRHSMTVNGFCESYYDLVKDVKLIKAMNANAIRTSHYPPHPMLPKICDEEGIYLLEEADIECHGVCSQRNFKEVEKYIDELAQSEIFAQNFLHRVERMYERDKNRQSVIIWSLGNESGWGKNLVACADFLHEKDTRPVHYEGSWSNILNKFQDGGELDLYSRMYPTKEWMREFIQDCERPLILCEYTHAMGNSCGDIKDYWDIMYDSPVCSGAFVWEWCSHSIIKDGKVLYGGDFGEYPHDYNFCMDGIVTTDRIPNPEYYQIKEVYSPVHVEECEGGVKIINRNYFTALKDITCVYFVERDGKEIFKTEIDISGIAPQSEKKFNIRLPKLSGYVTLNFRFERQGNAVAQRQIIVNDNFERELSELNLDALISSKDLKICAYRAVTDNDAYIKEEWLDYGLDRAQLFFTQKEGDKYIGKIVTEYLQPIGDIEIKLTHGRSGVSVTTSVNLADHVKSLPRFGYVFEFDKSFNKLTYFGRGENECYEDKKLCSPLSLYEADAYNMNYLYPKPQESGSHADTRFVCVSDGETSYMFDSDKNFSFNATPYALDDYKPHAHEMVKGDKIYLHIDYRMSGVGSNSCGPRIDGKYLITERSFSFSFNIKKFSGEEDLFKVHRS